MEHLLQWLALPQHGLSTVFVVAFISATLLPMGSEPVLFGLVKLNTELFKCNAAVFPVFDLRITTLPDHLVVGVNAWRCEVTTDSD